MMDWNAGYARLIERLASWAQAEDNIRAVVIIGSRARRDHPADEWADLDVLLLASHPEIYWQTTAWLHRLATPWVIFSEPTPDGRGREVRVLFEGGLDVDLVPGAFAGFRDMLGGSISPDIMDMLRRGVHLLVDKEALAAQLAGIDIPPARPLLPGEAAFHNAVNDMLFHAVWTAKKLRRGELWAAKYCCDTYTKGLLLRMLEWHARATAEGAVDTWMGGRFLDEWADPRAVASLPSTFARYEPEDVWRALQATMALYDWLGREAATAWGYTYPASQAERTAALVTDLFAGRAHADG